MYYFTEIFTLRLSLLAWGVENTSWKNGSLIELEIVS